MDRGTDARTLRRCAAATLLVGTSMVAAPSTAQDVRAVVCAARDRSAHELATVVESLGEPGRSALVAMAGASTTDALCGLAGLAAVRDRRVVPLLVAAIAAAPADSEVWRLVRWAAFVAGGPDPSQAAPFGALIPVLDTPKARAAAGDDFLRLLGELDSAEARDYLLRSLDSEQPDAARDAAIHALARQREPRARQRVAALGADVASGLAGNATYEQSRRLGAVAFYLLALGPDTIELGLGLVARQAPEDRADTAAWTTATLCEHAVRRPETRTATTAHREAVAAALTGAGVRWDTLVRGAFSCGRPQ